MIIVTTLYSVFEKPRFQNVLSMPKDEKPAFSKSSSLKGVFEEFRLTVDSRPKDRNKATFSNFFGIVSTLPKGPFTRKEDDPSARIILEGSFGLHAKTRLLGSTFHLVYMQDF